MTVAQIYDEVELEPGWDDEVRALAKRRNAVILAHNYQAPEIQDVADQVGDSLGLSRIAAGTEADEIVFAGVHFMAETAKILSPDKRVLIPDARAGCSLADSITVDQLRAWKAEHPGAAVVSYVNTSAEVKAESDICCTSANAVEVVESVPAEREVLFLPDMFLGAHVRRQTGRENLRIWMGECHVHAGINGAELRAQAEAHPDAEIYAIRMRVFYVRAVAGRRGIVPSSAPTFCRPAACWLRRGTAGPEPSCRHGDRDAAPVASGEPDHGLPSGQPAGRVPVHEDDHAGEAVAQPSVRDRRSDRSPGHRGPGAACRRRHDLARRAVRHRRVSAAAGWPRRRSPRPLGG